MAIDVGAACEDRGSAGGGGYTLVNANNAASANGTIDYICFYKADDWDGGDCDVGAFTPEGGTNFSCVAGNNNRAEGLPVSEGAGLQEFNAPGDFSEFDISLGDYPGIISPNNLDYDTSGGSGVYYRAGDNVPCDSVSFTLWGSGYVLSLRFTGEESGGAIEVTATLDELVLTENVVNVNKEINLSSGIDALSITEYNATVNAEINISAGIDALLIDEKQATVNAEIGIQAGVDALVLTENVAGVNAEVSLSAGIDELVIVAYSATVQVGANIEVSATVDELVIVENAVGVNAEINMVAGIDELAITENVANINAEINLTAGVDELALTENAANVNAEINISALLDSLVIAEYEATIKADVSMQATLEELVIAEYAASVVIGGIKGTVFKSRIFHSHIN